MSGYKKEEHCYDDIINLPHHRSMDREHMSLQDRAAQFAPFAALSGHEEAIEETARLTDDQVILDENTVERINGKLYELSQNLSEKHEVSVTYFVPDATKSGGAYLTDVGTISKIDAIEQILIMDSGMKIKMDRIVRIEDIE